MPEDPFALWENKIEIAGEGTPDKVRALYSDSVPPGEELKTKGPDRNLPLIVGVIAAAALLVAIYAAVKK